MSGKQTSSIKPTPKEVEAIKKDKMSTVKSGEIVKK